MHIVPDTICSATFELRTPLSMATPISVKAKALYLLPPQLEVTFWHLKISSCDTYL